MTLGALLDAGADFGALERELRKLHIHEYQLTAEKVAKHGITATQIRVCVDDHHHGRHEHSHHHGRSYSDIRRLIEDSELSKSVKDRSLAIFTKLGEAEAKIHGKPLDAVHFHEVGSVDAIVDIIGACICLESLGIDAVYSSPLPTFHGRVEMAHGNFPLPAPATAEILKGVPWQELGIEGEIVTPTGAAIVAALSQSFGPIPPMEISSIGYGAGSKEFGIPNVLRVMVGEIQQEQTPVNSSCAGGVSGLREDVVVIETNIDDMSPQVYEVVMERLFGAGALDVYMTPIQMKKNRPAVLLSVISAPGDARAMTNILFEETSTIGVRIDTRKRVCLPREMAVVETRFGPITIKLARRAGEVVNVHPEYEDCKAAAAEHSVSLKMVRDAAIAEFLNH